jgi:hypothetical protein
MTTTKMLSGMFFLLMLVAIPLAYADEHVETEASIEAELNQSAGVTPDSPFYGIDKALDSISLALTFDKAKRAEKSLAIAKERLLEVKAMIEENKADKAEDAEKEYEKALKDSEDAVDEIESTDNSAKARADIKAILKIRDETLSHSEKVALVKERILARMEGNMTTEQYARLNAIFDRIENKSLQVEAKLTERKEAAKIKYKVLSNMTDDDADTVEAELEADFEAKREARIQRHLEAVKERIANARERLETQNLTAEEKAELEAHLDAAEDAALEIEAALEAGDYDAAEAVAIRTRGLGNEIAEAARLLGGAMRNGTFLEAKETLRLRIEERREEHDDWLYEKLRMKFENSTARAEGLRDRLNLTVNGTGRLGLRSEVRTENRDGEVRERTRVEERTRSDGTVETRIKTETRVGGNSGRGSDDNQDEAEAESETEVEVRI